ncbi:MAG: c-type cytochrome [Candidatus Binatia bacterium]
MAVRGVDVEEEKKSYGSVFLLGAFLLVLVGLWAVFDDNFTRRKWKQYQSEFYRLDYEKARAAYTEEDRRLKADASYQELAMRLEAEQTSLRDGELAKRLSELRRDEEEAEVRFIELDQEVKFIKSELEEAWYEYDHAVQTDISIRPYNERIEELEREKAKLDPLLEEARKRREQIKKEKQEIESGMKELEVKLSKLTAKRDRWNQVMDNATLFRLGSVSFLKFTIPEVPFFKIPNIKQVVLGEFDRNNFDEPVARVDRCQSCHMGINRPGFESEPHPFRTHPRREILLADSAHPPEKFGCTPCHEGQGAAVSSVEQAHGEVAYWEHPLLRGAKVQSSCASCHLDVQRLEDAPLLANGQRLFEQMGCTGCHLAEGYENIPKVGPSLRRVIAKVDPSWMVRWILNPNEFRPRTRMPNFSLKEDQAVAIAAYLWSASREEGEQWLGRHPLPEGYRDRDEQLISKGKELVQSVGCRGCHGFAEGEFSTVLGKNKDIVPNLQKIAAKIGPGWTYHWLKNPRGFSPATRMPNLRLTDEESLAITAYLMTLGKKAEGIAGLKERLRDVKNVKRGETLIRKYGCFGCHDIPGMEKESRIGVELTTFGSKPLEELFFGNRTDIPHTWDDWTFNKLKSPRIYATPRVEQVMPQFGLADDDIKALRALLASFREAKVPDRFRADRGEKVLRVVEGRRLMHQYNCIGCHIIEKGGGFIRKYYENPALAPPSLDGEGEKVQTNWLFGFLKQPIPLRPWLRVRMPTFGFSDEEANLLVDYFNGLSKIQIPYVYFDDQKIPKEHLEAAKAMFSKDYFDCLGCHQQGDKKPEGPPEGWAPDLTLARRRLNPHWILRWLRDPQKVQPGTKMPSFYPEGPEDILGGKDEKQIEALRDYIMVLGRTSPVGEGGRGETR